MLQSALVPGRANSTSTRPRAVLSLSNTCVPLDAGRYHSNDTASSPPPRITAPTKRRCCPLLQRARGRLLLKVELISPLRAAESVVQSNV